ATRCRPDRLRVPVDPVEERALVFREAEEPGRLAEPLHGVAEVGALPVLDLGFRIERLAPGAVHPLVVADVEIAGGLHARDERLDPAAMARLGRPDEVVMADGEALPQLVVAGDDAIGERDRRQPLLRGRALDLLSVLVGSGEEADVPAGHPPVT